jgi:hypothetical protein
MLRKLRRNGGMNEGEKFDGSGSGNEGEGGSGEGEGGSEGGNEGEGGSGEGEGGNGEGEGEGEGGNDTPPIATPEQLERQKIEDMLDDKYGDSYDYDLAAWEREQKEKAEQERDKAEVERDEARDEAQTPPPPSTIKIDSGDGNGSREIPLTDKHFMYPLVLDLLASNCTPLLSGPAGSGKTHIGRQLAQGLYDAADKFYFCGKLDSAFELTGFMTVDGSRCVRTALTDAWDTGGLFMFDEFDRSDPKATVAFNAGLANRMMSFPDGIRTAHVGTRLMATANTNLQGIDRRQQYITAEPQDASSIDRFQFVPFPYDSYLTAQLAGATGPVLEMFRGGRPTPDFFHPAIYNGDDACPESSVNYFVIDCHEWMDKIRELNSRHLISPRAVTVGADLLRRGYRREWVEKLCVWKGLEAAQVGKIGGADVETRMAELEASIGMGPASKKENENETVDLEAGVRI